LTRNAKEWSGKNQVATMIGFYVYPYDENTLAPSLKKLINKPTFMPVNEIREELTLDTGKYVLLCCTFEGQQLGRFSV